MGKPEWITDPQLATRSDWETRCDDLIRPAVEEWAQDKTRVEVVSLLSNAGVPAGPVNTMQDLITDDHVRSHEMFVPVERDSGEPILVAGSPLKFGGRNAPTATSIPALGEHTVALLTSELGMSEQEIRDLQKRGVIKSD